MYPNHLDQIEIFVGYLNHLNHQLNLPKIDIKMNQPEFNNSIDQHDQHLYKPNLMHNKLNQPAIIGYFLHQNQLLIVQPKYEVVSRGNSI